MFGRGKPRAPTKLNMKANEDFSKSIIPKGMTNQKITLLEPETIADSNGVETNSNANTNLNSDSANANATVIDLNAARAAKPVKNLNIYFMYNGHEWEAHEVLGVPAASQMPAVTEMYQKLILTSDPSTFQFYEAAYQSILKRWKDRL
jgi:hypothetical protein